MTPGALFVTLVAPFALAAIRLAPALVAIPALGGELPLPALVSILAVILLAAAPAVLHAAPLATASAFGPALLHELLLGIALAAVLGLPFFAVRQGANLLDAVRDDRPRDGDGPLARLLHWSFVAVFAAAGGLRALVRAVVDSFVLVPVGSSQSPAPLADLAARFTAEALAASVALFAAAWLATLTAELLIALAARIGPASGAVGLALPARALVPLLVTALALAWTTDAALDLAHHGFVAIPRLAR